MLVIVMYVCFFFFEKKKYVMKFLKFYFDIVV